MTIIGLTGEQASGKGTVADYLVKKYKAKKFRMSKVWDDILERLYVPNERKNQVGLGMSIRGFFGEDILARVILEDMLRSKEKIALLDGMRFKSELKIFKKVKGFKLVYVTAPAEMRFEKIIHRGEKAGEKNLTFRQFKKAEATFPTEVEIPSLGRASDYRIDNVGTKKDLYAKVDEVMKELRRK